MKLRNTPAQRQNQKAKIIYASGFTLILAIIAVFSFLFNIGNVRSIFASDFNFNLVGKAEKSNPSKIWFPNEHRSKTYTAIQSGKWNNADIWSPKGHPGVNDIVDIHGGYIVTITSNEACSELLLAGNGTSNGTLTFSTLGSPSLKVSGNINCNTGDGAGFITMVSPTNGHGASLKVEGTITNSATGNVHLYISTALGTTLTVSHIVDYNSGLICNFNRGTVRYMGTDDIIPTTYNNLSINSGSKAIKLIGPTTVNGTLNLSSGMLAIGNNKLIVNGNITGADKMHYIQSEADGILEMLAIAGGTTFPIGPVYSPITIIPTLDATFDVSVSKGVTDNFGKAIDDKGVGITWAVKNLGGEQDVIVVPQWNASDELPDLSRKNSFVASRTSANGLWMPTKDADMAIGSGPFSLKSGRITMASAKPYYLHVGCNASTQPATASVITTVLTNTTLDAKIKKADKVIQESSFNNFNNLIDENESFLQNSLNLTSRSKNSLLCKNGNKLAEKQDTSAEEKDLVKVTFGKNIVNLRVFNGWTHDQQGKWISSPNRIPFSRPDLNNKTFAKYKLGYENIRQINVEEVKIDNEPYFAIIIEQYKEHFHDTIDPRFRCYVGADYYLIKPEDYNALWKDDMKMSQSYQASLKVWYSGLVGYDDIKMRQKYISMEINKDLKYRRFTDTSVKTYLQFGLNPYQNAHGRYMRFFYQLAYAKVGKPVPPFDFKIFNERFYETDMILFDQFCKPRSLPIDKKKSSEAIPNKSIQENNFDRPLMDDLMFKSDEKVFSLIGMQRKILASLGKSSLDRTFVSSKILNYELIKPYNLSFLGNSKNINFPHFSLISAQSSICNSRPTTPHVGIFS